MEEKGKVPISDHLQYVKHYLRSCKLSLLILAVIKTSWGRYYQPVLQVRTLRETE